MLTIQKGINSFYIGNSEEAPLAEICFKYEGDDIAVYRTFVSEDLRGQNIARRLLAKMAEFARDENKKIIPQCSFVEAEFNKNSTYGDVWKK